MAKEAVTSDDFYDIRTIGGADCAYFNDMVIACVVSLDFPSLACIAASYDTRPVTFPYIPGLLAYREMDAVMDAYKKATVRPDLLMVDGFGVNHPRRCGIACAIGVRLNIPTIGVGKSFLCGQLKDDDIYQSGERVGRRLYTGKETKPIYVSPGHRISLDSSVDIVLRCLRGRKLPEPVRLADAYAAVMREKLKAGIV